MTAKKPSEIARARLDKRARQQISLINKVVPKELQKSPSQKRSENAKKKEMKRAGVKGNPEVPNDCFGCPKEPCGKTLNTCEEKGIVHRCLKCGLKVRHRVVIETPWEYCPVCRR